MPPPGTTPARDPTQYFNDPPSGSYRLHWVSRPVGTERWTTVRDGDLLRTSVDFLYTDRGTDVPLTATLLTTEDGSPRRLEVAGKVARRVRIDVSVDVADGRARIEDGRGEREVAVPERFFTVAGYAPIAVQAALLDYWSAHGRPARLPTLPTGEVRIEDRGPDRMTIGGEERTLERYGVDGLIWGRETLWTDPDGALVAAVTIDGEGDPFQAVAEGWEEGLDWFVARAARDGLARLGEAAPGEPVDEKPLALVGGKVVTGLSERAIEDGVVVVEGGRIAAVGPRPAVEIPEGARTLDVHGGTVAPGLWDMHAHLAQVEWGPVYLAAGVTTVRDVGNQFEFVRAFRDASAAGRGPAPRILVAGIIFGDEVSTPEEARALVRTYHDAGFQQIKVYSYVRPDLVPVITAEAHALGMTVTGHIPEGMDLYDGIEAGMDQVNHVGYVAPVMVPDSAGEGALPDPDSPAGRRAIETLVERGIVVDATVALYELGARPADVPLADVEPGGARVAPELVAPLEGGGVQPADTARARSRFERYLAIVRALHEAGVTIVAGSDMGVPGYTLHREIELYHRAGFTPLEALRAATAVPAEVMGLAGNSGTLEPGKSADLIVVDGDPLEDPANLRAVRTVITHGRIYDPATLWRLVGFTPR